MTRPPVRSLTPLAGAVLGALVGAPAPAQGAPGPAWTEAELIGSASGLAFDTARGVAVLVSFDASAQRRRIWEWDGRAWSLRDVGPGPGSFAERGALAYDEARGVTVLLQGEHLGLSSTWEWDGARWVRRQPAVTPRQGGPLVYDASRAVTVLYDGTDTWEWDGQSWARRTTGTSGPPPRGGAALAFDRARGRTVLFGGQGASGLLADTWEWDGVQWTQRQPATAPASRLGHAMAWDGARGTVVLFGGTDFSQDPRLVRTWDWDGQDWSDRGPATDPGARQGHLMTGDAARGTVLLHGGSRFGFPPVETTSTWELGSAGWVVRQDSVRPNARVGHALAWCERAGRVVLFGGSFPSPIANGFSVSYTDTWEWDGARWRERFSANVPSSAVGPMAEEPGGTAIMFTCGGGETWRWDGDLWQRLPTASAPPGRARHAMAYDPERRRTVLLALSVDSQTWEWDGAVWSLRAVTGPPPGIGLAMAYDGAGRRVLLFGSVGTFEPGQTWAWDGVAWTRLWPSTVPPSSGSGFGIQYAMARDEARERVVLFASLARDGSADVWEWDGIDWQMRTPAVRPGWRFAPVAYDRRRERIVMFGGLVPDLKHSSAKGDTWEYATNAPAAYATFGTGCAGTAGAPVLAAARRARPWLGDLFTVELTNLPPGASAVLLLTGASRTAWNGLPLPLGLWPFGMPGCELLVSVDVVDVLVGSGGVARHTETVPGDASLLGGSFYQQAVVADPGVNPAGAIVSNATHGVLGVR